MTHSRPKFFLELQNWRRLWPFRRKAIRSPPPETTATIRAWAYATFGAPKGPVSVVQRAQRELDELLAEALKGSPPAVLAEEAADVVIVLCRLYDWTDVERKMAINRQREWIVNGDGHGQHVKKAPPITTGPSALGYDEKV